MPFPESASLDMNFDKNKLDTSHGKRENDVSNFYFIDDLQSSIA